MYDNTKLEKDIKELKIENRIQTFAVILVFFFGIVTIMDLFKKQ